MQGRECLLGDRGEIGRGRSGTTSAGEFKGPLAVAPLFLKTNRRITALITVICLALLIFCLAERQVRKSPGPARRDDDRPARLRPHPGQTHRPDHLRVLQGYFPACRRRAGIACEIIGM